MVKNLSVFFPCVNEEGNVETIVSKAVKVLEDLKINYEIILINDGSIDNTGKVADQLSKKNPNIRVIHHQKNLGYGEALKSGFYGAKYEVIVYTDGDGQFDFSEVTKFLEKIDESDLIIGYRLKRQDPFFRIIFKKGWALSLWMMFGLTLKDVDCGFKMIKRKVLETIPRLESQRGAMINAELAIKARKSGFKIGQVGVNHYPRLSGKPTGANFKVILSSYLDLLKLWWSLKDSKSLFVGLLMVIILASFLRFYRLADYMTFLGDEGRDAIIVRNILIKGDLPFIGPPSSVGNIYLGPFYYYMMVIPMAIFWLSSVAAAGMNALIGVATVILIYYLGKIWFGRITALAASFLYAISPVTIIYSRSSWNPNPAPFFALLGVWAAFKSYKSKDFKWFIFVSIAVAACIQMHYLALMLIPTFFLLWLYQLRSVLRKNVLFGSLGAVAAFLLMILPLILFDFKHHFLNFNAIINLLTSNKSVGFNPLGIFIKVPQIYFSNLINRYISGDVWQISIIASILIFIPVVKFIWDIFSRRKTEWSILALSIWMLIGLIGLSFYQGSIYDHYLGFFNPAPYLLLAASFSLILRSTSKELKIFVKGGILILMILLTFFNLKNNPLLNPPNNQLQRTENVARTIILDSSKMPFNFALIAKNNYDSAYQFYMELYGQKPKIVPAEKTRQLFVICEDQICDPTHSPKYEIAGFGWSKIEWEKEISGVKLFKLVPNPTGKP